MAATDLRQDVRPLVTESSHLEKYASEGSEPLGTSMASPFLQVHRGGRACSDVGGPRPELRPSIRKVLCTQNDESFGTPFKRVTVFSLQFLT